MADACPWGDPQQAPLAQYPCPAGCGCWVRDGNCPCLGCWYRARPLDEAVLRARHMPADHPRRPAGQLTPRVLSGG